ncbi:L-glyceraldehyde 3-phosphate reductase [Lentisphaera profundi]|uniref:L-glyceraldehyde 3-phosphate reductase n=1 Tax=Lentisphaera profundi TaxID=1658616 RepID=A0ABY7VNU3_9BACT|nr:L-glyceraldehyde 3-phosphate reductase [Lentisphaera profundi]WDE95446.1 L-glyceraldehyde 3-phosphate reductase [Lentisphaera profundi]
MYLANENRYESMIYNRCGKSGLKLPAVSLGLWHNWGGIDNYENAKAMSQRAFDLGITHFDLANNYGPPAGSAESNFGKILSEGMGAYRDEMIISSKAGYDMWPGPYGEWGSRKYMIASCDQSLKRMGLDYIDVFYSHRFDPETPLEETMGALDTIVRSGRALYAGISSYDAENTKKAAAILKDLGTPCLIHQPSYSMFDRWVEDDLLNAVKEEGMGCISFSSLAQGLLTDKYLNGIPADSRAAKSAGALDASLVNEVNVAKIKALNDLAQSRGQNLSQMAIAWVLRQPAMTSVILGASKVKHIEDAVAGLNNLNFTNEELDAIDLILK